MEKITDKIKAIIYIIINTVFDLILQTGVYCNYFDVFELYF